MLTLNVGLSKKIGLPEYSSLGADCHLSLELPGDLLDHPEELRKRIQTAYAIAAQAVADELARQQTTTTTPAVEATTRPTPRPTTSASASNGQAKDHSRKYRENGAEEIRGGHAPASQAQVKAIYAIARKLEVDIDSILEEQGIHALSQLTLRRASEVIDQLKEMEATAAR